MPSPGIPIPIPGVIPGIAKPGITPGMARPGIMPGIPTPGIMPGMPRPGIIGPRRAVVSSWGEVGGVETLEEEGGDEGLEFALDASSGMADAVAVARRRVIGRIGFIVVVFCAGFCWLWWCLWVNSKCACWCLFWLCEMGDGKGRQAREHGYLRG